MVIPTKMNKDLNFFYIYILRTNPLPTLQFKNVVPTELEHFCVDCTDFLFQTQWHVMFKTSALSLGGWFVVRNPG